MSEIEILLSQAVPAVSAAVSAYGAAVLTRAEDEAAGATVRLGQRLLERLRRNAPDRPALDAAVTDLAEAEDDPDAVAALRLRIRQALRDSPSCARSWRPCCPPRPWRPAASGRCPSAAT
ncbi:hypothetical protein AB6O49_20410 [Streptomyces sp. SBR177]